MKHLKKIVLFLLLLILPLKVSASSYIQDFQVKNGTLTIPFNEKNNLYTIKLEENAQEVLFEYCLENEQSKVEIIGNNYKNQEENVMILKVIDEENNDSQSYTFYLEKEEDKSVIAIPNDTLNNIENTKEIPYLKEIVIGICLALIVTLFKILIINFFKKSKKLKSPA